MRNTTAIYPSDSPNSMTINAINIETNPMTAITTSHHQNECQPMGLPVATKSQPKPKNRSIDSQSRATKRPPSERRFKCDQCERMFFTRKDVKRHLVVHTGIRNFACPFCTQRFGRKDHLVRHAKKSHNRDTRSSTVKHNSHVAQHSDKRASNGVPTLIEAKSNGISSVPTVAVGGQQLAHNQSKQSFNYQNNCQNGDQSLVLLTNSSNNNINAINNSHSDPNGNTHCGPYAHHPNQTPNHTNHHVMIAGMHANESLCQYMSGVHPFEDMISSNGIKGETPPITAHHYFAFPVNSGGLTYPLPNPSFLPNCLVTNSGPGLNSCASSASVAAFGIPVSNVANASNPFSVDVNPSLPHFNQAFQ